MYGGFCQAAKESGRGGRKAGFHCNMHLETGYSTNKSSNSSIILCVLRDAYHELFCVFLDFHASGTQGTEVAKSVNLSAQRFLGSYGWPSVTYDWLDSGCHEYGRPIKTNAFTPKLCQKLLRPKLVGRKNNYKTLRRAHKFDMQNTPTRISPRGIQTAFGFPLLTIFVYLFVCLSPFLL